MTFYSITLAGRGVRKSVTYDVALDVIEKIAAAFPGVDRDDSADALRAENLAARLARKLREDAERAARWASVQW